MWLFVIAWQNLIKIILSPAHTQWPHLENFRFQDASWQQAGFPCCCLRSGWGSPPPLGQAGWGEERGSAGYWGLVESRLYLTCPGSERAQHSALETGIYCKEERNKWDETCASSMGSILSKTNNAHLKIWLCIGYASWSKQRRKVTLGIEKSSSDILDTRHFTRFRPWWKGLHLSQRKTEN